MTESTNTLAFLQLARGKGLLSAEAASTALGVDVETIRREFEQFRTQGGLDSTARGWRLTPAGRQVTSAMVADERATLNAAALKTLYEEFCTANAELKATMTAWQLLADGTPNDHSDKVYDQTVTARLSLLHANADSTIERIGQAAPRLPHYRRAG